MLRGHTPRRSGNGAVCHALAAALRERGVPVAHLTSPGDGHGFRKAENIARTLEAGLSFCGRVFGLTPAGDIALVVVKGL